MTAPGRAFARPLDAIGDVRWEREAAVLVVHTAKEVTVEDPYMAGHFPGLTLYPAIFLLEGVRQAAGVALAVEDDWLEIDRVRSVRILRPMLAGDRLVLRLAVSAGDDPGRFHVDAVCTRDGSATARITVELTGKGGAS